MFLVSITKATSKCNNQRNWKESKKEREGVSEERRKKGRKTEAKEKEGRWEGRKEVTRIKMHKCILVGLNNLLHFQAK